MLLIVYLMALLSVVRVFKIGFAQLVVAGVCAMLPFGPVWLEHRWRTQAVLGI